MDSKVNAMLKIIEEDADSFAKRAEMYYKRRPELLNLVEEFYRTYRALVERHTFLTKELRQNIAPALQAQLGVSYTSPPNLPDDVDGRPNSDGLDIASLSSYTLPGSLEIDKDSLIDFSANKMNNDKDTPSASSMVVFETHEFDFKPSSSSSEEELLSPRLKDRDLHMVVDATSSIELKSRIEILELEKKVLMVKSDEDGVNITDLKSEVSDLLMKVKALEAEDKLAKDRLNSLLQMKQSLEAENLKLNHALITCMEEKTQLSEARDHGLQEMFATGERISQLEQEVSLLEQKMKASHTELLTTQEKSKKSQGECEKLQQTLSAFQDENQRNVLALKELNESHLKELHKQIVSVEQENQGFKKQIATHTLKVQELEQQEIEASKKVELLLTDVEDLKEARDQALTKCEDFEVESLASKQDKERLKAELELKTAEGVALQNENSVLEDELAEVRLEIEKLQSQVSDFSLDKASLRLELVEALEEVKALESNQVEAQKALLCLEGEKLQLTEEVKQGQALADHCNGRMFDLENQNKQLSRDLKQAEQQAAKLQEVIAGLSIKYTTQSVGLAKLEEQISLLKVEKEIDCKTLAKSEGKVHDLEVRVSELLAESAASNEQLSQMSEGTRSLEAELADVNRQKEALSAKLSMSGDRVMLLQKQLDSTRELEDAQQVELQQRAERIQALEMDVQSMQTGADNREHEMLCKLQRSLDDIACLQTIIQELEGKISHHMEDQVSLVKGFEEQKESLQMQLQNSNDWRQNLEAGLLKLHEAVSLDEENNSIPLHVPSRSLNAEIIIPGRFEHLHQKIGSLLEERKQLVKEVGSRKGENDILVSTVESLEKHKVAVHMELTRALEEREQIVTSLGVEVTKVNHLEETLKRTQQALDNSIQEKMIVMGQLKSASEEGESLRNDLSALQDELRKNQHALLEAARDSEKLAGESSQLRQAHAAVENELNINVSKLSSVHEHASKLIVSKRLLEEEAQHHLHQIKTRNEEVERLQCQLQDAEHKVGRLEDELFVLLSNVRRLNHDLTCVKDEKETLSSNLKDLQSEMAGVQGENEHLKAQLGAASLELEGKETENRCMQEPLKTTESHSSSLAEALLSMNNSLGAQVEGLQEGCSQFKATNIEIQKDPAGQLECVSKLENELSGLHGEMSLLKEEMDRGAKELAGVQREEARHLKELEGAKKREHKKDGELLELLALAESLKQSLAAKELENSNLVEDLRKSIECHKAAEKRYMDEIGFLQSEELKWRTEASATSEKVASLRMENAALHQDLSLKLELVLKQQQELESLTEECKNLSQALQDMLAEMNDLRSDLQIFKDVVIPSMEERAVELQVDIKGLTVSNERHVAEIVTLRTQLIDAKGELQVLHDSNAILKMELIFNVEMLKHVDVVLETAKTQSAALCKKLSLQEKQCQMLEQMVTRATDENVGFRKKLLSITEEKNNAVAEVCHLLAMLSEVGQLQRDLAFAREGLPLVKETDPNGGGLCANLDSLSDSHKGIMETGVPIEEQNDEVTRNFARGSQESVITAPLHKFQQACSGFKHGDVASFFETQQQRESTSLTSSHPVGVEYDGSRDLGTTEKDAMVLLSVSSSPVVIKRLKEEIAFLQENIQRLELAAAEQGARDLLPSAQEDSLSPCKNSTASSTSILTVDDTPGRLDEIQRLKEENRTLTEEVQSLKGQSWMDHNLIENTVRDLQASKDVLQEKNGHLQSEVSSCKEDIVRLQEESILLQQKYAAILEDVEASVQEKRKFEETLRMLEDVIGSLECSNRRLQTENELTGDELKKVQGVLANIHHEGTDVVAQLRVTMVATFEEVKLMIDECRKEMGEEGILRFMMGNGRKQHLHERISLLRSEQSMFTKSSNEMGLEETTQEPPATNRLFLTELQARAEEANVLVEVLLCIRKMLSLFFSSSERTCQRDTPLSTMSMKGEEAGRISETMSPEKDVDFVNSVHPHINLAERLHQAFADEKLEHELLQFKEGRKQLEEELKLRLDEVEKMELELGRLEGLLKEEGSGKREGVVTHEEQKSKNKRAEESVKELRENLAQQRGQICRMKEEIMFGEAQQEVAAEDQMTILVSMESAPSMDGWDDEQVSSLSKELESLRSLNRRHSAELQTISQDLQSMGSIIKSVQDQLLQEFSADGEEEIMSVADLTQKSNIVDLRAQNSRVSTDSTEQLLSPSLPTVEGDFASAHQMISEGSIGQFPLKPRNFGFSWFMLLFSPDRKASSLVRERRSHRSSSGRAALVVERGRRKVAGCLTCVSNTNRLDSFEHR